jgi:hypothetical protein
MRALRQNGRDPQDAYGLRIKRNDTISENCPAFPSGRCPLESECKNRKKKKRCGMRGRVFMYFLSLSYTIAALMLASSRSLLELLVGRATHTATSTDPRANSKAKGARAGGEGCYTLNFKRNPWGRCTQTNTSTPKSSWWERPRTQPPRLIRKPRTRQKGPPSPGGEKWYTHTRSKEVPLGDAPNKHVLTRKKLDITTLKRGGGGESRGTHTFGVIPNFISILFVILCCITVYNITFS